MKKVQFTGGLKFDENGTTYRAVDPTVTQYVGEPSELLDRAWTSLLLGEKRSTPERHILSKHADHRYSFIKAKASI